ncbi:facilitated trehalose transporter Tret1-like isoform X2 [Oratosquilla oratoria]
MGQNVFSVAGFWRQMALAMLLSGIITTLGEVITWSTVLPKVNNSTANFDLGLVDMQWIIASIGATAVFVPIITGPLMEIIGTARLLIICAVPTVALWWVMAFVPSKIGLYVGRLGHGLSMGMMTTFINPLVAELVSPEIRGIVGAWMEISLSLGMLYTTVLVAFLPWWLVTALLAVPMALSIPFYFAVPESPYWLAKRGRDEDALKALRRLRGPRGRVKEELAQIKRANEEQPSITVKDQFRLLKEKSNYQPFFLVLSIQLATSFTGQGIIFEYAVIIFKETHVDLDPFQCNILVSVSRLLSSIVSLFIIDQVDRKPLLVVSALACALSLSLSSVSMLIPQSPDWLTTTFILVYVFMLGVGLNPVPIIAMSEIMPTPIRSVGISILLSIVNLSFFTGSATFPIMIINIGLVYSFFIFASFALLTAFIYWRFAPETRGRSLAELQNTFVKLNGAETHTLEDNTESNVPPTESTNKETTTYHDPYVSPESLSYHDSDN